MKKENEIKLDFVFDFDGGQKYEYPNLGGYILKVMFPFIISRLLSGKQ